MSKLARAPSLLLLALSALYLLLLLTSTDHTSGLWGLNLFSYLDWSSRLPIVLAALLCSCAVILIGSNLEQRKRLRDVLVYLLIPVASLITFYLLRVQTHYLGDGILRVRELEIDVWWLPTEPLGQAVNYIVYKLTERLLGFDAETAVKLVSFLGGLLYYYALIRFVKTLFRNAESRLPSFIILFVSGTTVLFCGYTETYMLLPGLITLFVTAGITAARSDSSPFGAYLLFLLLVLFHFKMLMLAPCVLALCYFRFKDGQRSWLIVGLATLGLAVAVVLLLPRLSNLPTLDAASLLLPLTDSETGYAVLSTQHWLDVVSQLLLTCAAGLLLILASVAMKSRSKLLKDRARIFMLAALPGALAMLLFLRSSLGFAVDWDLFSTATLIVSFAANSQLLRLGDRSLGKTALIALGAVAFLSFFSFAAVNARPATAIERQVDILNLYGKEGAIGFETLGNDLNARGETELAEKIWIKSVRLRPHVRLYGNLAQLALDGGRYAEAKQYCEKGLELDPRHALLWNLIAVAQLRLGDVVTSESSFRQAVRYAPDNPVFHHNFACMLGESDNWEAALEESRQAASLRPGDPTILFQLGVALRQLGKNDDAGNAFIQVRETEPENVDACLELARLSIQIADTLRAREILADYLRRYPRYPSAQQVQSLLEKL